ncbi:MAG TPA: hypothetical protein VEA80_06765 [Vitreimonas sp.]|uniref:hypothetical protein n=1 Tax=Vitreimonas sp. TaxID=3069702 RepID=UPI002D2AA7B3|nr:hypothetical protein [Vitreimonas sp.]HYD87156.1 hypothetical protein [Vitreimonas sp.]
MREHAEAAAAWRAECEHKRWLFIDTIDRVPVDLLIALIDHAFPPATAGFFEPLGVTRDRADFLARRNAAEREWAEAWKRHHRSVGRSTQVIKS